jgi:hypothetical protein
MNHGRNSLRPDRKAAEPAAGRLQTERLLQKSGGFGRLSRHFAYSRGRLSNTVAT